MAEQLGYELLENWDDKPVLLELLARINLMKGQNETAQVFINRLSRDFVYDTKANQMQSELNEKLSDSAFDLNEIPVLQSTAASDALSAFSIEQTLKELLRENPNNRMAYEYLAAYYLLKKDLTDLI